LLADIAAKIASRITFIMTRLLRFGLQQKNQPRNGPGEIFGLTHAERTRISVSVAHGKQEMPANSRQKSPDQKLF